MDKDIQKRDARVLMTLVNTLSLFVRRTMLEWLPDLQSKVGITEQRYAVMFELALQPDISLKDLAKRLVVSHSSLSVMINSMVEQGLVIRVDDPADRRRVLLRLSEQGNRDLNTAEEYLIEGFEQYLQTLPEADRRDLVEAGGSMLEVTERILER